MRYLGLVRQESMEVDKVDDLVLGSNVEAIESFYTRGNGQEAEVTFIQFSDRNAADSFFEKWRQQVVTGFYDYQLDLNNSDFEETVPYNDSLLSIQINFPGVWIDQEGQFARSYDEDRRVAYNAWQYENWVTIIEVPGGLPSIRLSRDIKEAVAESYQINQ